MLQKCGEITQFQKKNLYNSQNITRGTRLAGHIAGAKAVRNSSTTIGAEVEEERPNESDNIQIHLERNWQ
jgi:hypothetical protein